MVARAGPLATASRKPRQARKGAAVAVTTCAGVWLARAASTPARALGFGVTVNVFGNTPRQ